MIPDLEKLTLWREGIPRESGDDPKPTGQDLPTDSYSPRERG